MVAVGADLEPPNENDIVIDANGLTLLPGVIAPRVHFREPDLKDKEPIS